MNDVENIFEFAWLLYNFCFFVYIRKNLPENFISHVQGRYNHE